MSSEYSKEWETQRLKSKCLKTKENSDHSSVCYLERTGTPLTWMGRDHFHLLIFLNDGQRDQRVTPFPPPHIDENSWENGG